MLKLGFEPQISSSLAWCSYQLSYWGTHHNSATNPSWKHFCIHYLLRAPQLHGDFREGRGRRELRTKAIVKFNILIVNKKYTVTANSILYCTVVLDKNMCVPMPTHCTITCVGFRTRRIGGVECGLFSIHTPLGQTTLRMGRISV